LSNGERRLAAMMFTDVVGYSSMTSEDERHGLRLLGEHRSLLQSVFPKHDGRVVKTMGDGFLVEFSSAVKSVECAVEAQEAMRGLNARRSPDDRILIRIGIHVGDVIHENGDVLGDAVNVAARVQPLAEPGGICVTRQVIDQIERKVDYKTVKVGTRELKNIRHPVEVYRVVLPSEMSGFGKGNALDPRRLAILPFINLSGGSEDRYFADGMTEELISTVSRIGELSVISRTSVMKYKDTTTPINEIGAELSTGTVLEGSVRKSGNRVRITVQLIDAQSDKHLWAQSYDRDLTDVFAIQGDIAQQIAEALRIQLLSDERRGIQRMQTVSPDAYSLYLKGRFYWNERTEEEVRKALQYFDDAIKMEHGFAMAYSGLADCYLVLADYGWMPPGEGASKAKEYALKALELDDSLAEAHASLGLAMMDFWDFKIAEMELKRALELRPSYAQALHWYTSLLYYTRRYEEAHPKEKKAFELDPHSRVISMGYGIDLMTQGRMEEALKQLDKVIELNPDFGSPHYWKAFVHVLSSEYEKAIEEGRKAVELEGYANVELFLAWVYAAAGQREEAEKILQKVLSAPKGYLSPVDVGRVKLLLGQEEEGFSWLRKALDERDSNLFVFGFTAQERKYMLDPRWKEIESKLGLPPGGKLPDL